MGDPMLQTATTATFLILLLFIYAISAPGSTALAQSSPSTATPRPADITAILDQEKQDPRRSAKTRADADPPSTQDENLLAQFYYRRGQARFLMGRNREALSDAEMAIQHAGNSDTERFESLLSNAYSSLGDHKHVIEINQMLAQRYATTQKGKNFSINLRLVQSYLALGD